MTYGTSYGGSKKSNAVVMDAQNFNVLIATSGAVFALTAGEVYGHNSNLSDIENPC